MVTGMIFNVTKKHAHTTGVGKDGLGCTTLSRARRQKSIVIAEQSAGQAESTAGPLLRNIAMRL